MHAVARMLVDTKFLDFDVVAFQVSCAFVNPYKVLQVSEDADPKEIKRAYRKLALR